VDENGPLPSPTEGVKAEARLALNSEEKILKSGLFTPAGTSGSKIMFGGARKGVGGYLWELMQFTSPKEEGDSQRRCKMFKTMLV